MSVFDPDEIRELMGEAYQSLELIARSLHVKDARLQPTLDAIVSAAVDAVSPAQHAGLILVIRGELVPQSTIGRPPLVLDLLQQKLRVGPCFDAAASQTPNRIDDASKDDRWPDFMAGATRLGVSSVLCVPLWVNDRQLGALSLYSERLCAFGDSDERVANLFAALSAVALDGAARQDQLLTALANRDVIGQAKGILMERHRLTADAAFRRLTQASQHQNRKLIELAVHLVETGELFGPSA